MTGHFIRIVLLLFLMVSALPLAADVIITKDDMILNGKILEEKKPEYVRFANYHGNFTIKYMQIKEIHRTESFEGDMEFLQRQGKTVNEDEIKNNYLSGQKKLEEFKKVKRVSEGGPGKAVIMLDVFYDKNFGEIESVLTSSKGCALSGEFTVDSIQLLKSLYISGIDTELSFLSSEKDEKYIRSLSAAAGPLWRFPVSMFSYSFNFNISAAFGAGWYSIKNREAEESAIKPGVTFHAGPSFEIYSAVISPRLRIDYIYDGYAPLIGAGFSLGAGYRF